MFSECLKNNHRRSLFHCNKIGLFINGDIFVRWRGR